jgi:hypothetical protein
LLLIWRGFWGKIIDWSSATLDVELLEDGVGDRAESKPTEVLPVVVAVGCQLLPTDAGWPRKLSPWY